MRPVVALRSVDPQFVEKILPGIAVAHHSPPPRAKLVAAQVCHSLAGRPPRGYRQSSSIAIDTCHASPDCHQARGCALPGYIHSLAHATLAQSTSTRYADAP